MADEKKVCSACGQVNEPQYLFCTNCGNELTDNPQNTGERAEYTPPPQFNMGGGYNNYGFYNTYVDYSQVEPTINDVDTKKVQEYVGEKGRNYFLQAFITIKRTGRKVFFNWPIVLLGMLVGAPYAASWFYYRKMYKMGLILSLAILLLTTVSTAVNYNTTKNVAQNVLEAAQNEEKPVVEALLDTTLNEELKPSSATTISNNIIDAIMYGGMATVAIYANLLYLKDITRKIKKSDEKSGTENPTTYKNLGGTSITSAIVIPTLFYFASYIIALIPFIAALF